MKLLTWLVLILAVGAVLLLHDVMLQRQYGAGLAYGAAACEADRAHLAELRTLTDSLCFWYLVDGERRCIPRATR